MKNIFSNNFKKKSPFVSGRGFPSINTIIKKTQ
jgi:hypothetical protein